MNKDRWFSPKAVRLSDTGVAQGKAGIDPFEAVLHYCTVGGTMYSMVRNFSRNVS